MLKKWFVRAIGPQNYIRYVKFIDHLYLSFLPFKPRGAELIKQYFIQPGDVVIDVGANIGRFTGFAAHLAGKTGKVYSFEPVVLGSRVLKAMVALRRLRQVVVVEMALSHEVGTEDIVIPLRDGWMPMLPIAHLGATTRQNVWRETIRTQRLDDFCAAEHVERVDFIKCDTEGHEYFVFKGGMNILAQYRPTVFCEIHEQYLARHNLTPSDVFELFTSSGYQSYLPVGQGKLLVVQGYQKPANYLFIHPSKQPDRFSQIAIESA